MISKREWLRLRPLGLSVLALWLGVGAFLLFSSGSLLIWLAVSALVGILLLTYRWPIVGLFLFIAPTLVRSQVFEELLGVGEDAGSGMQKALVIAAVALLALICGLRFPPFGVLILLVFFGISWVLTASMNPAMAANPELAKLVKAGALTSLATYVYPFLFFAVAWNRFKPTNVLRVIQIAPLAVLIIGLLFQLIDYRDVIQIEFTGVPRLSGSLAPAYLASYAMFSALSSLWFWQRGEKLSLWAAFVAMIVAFLTGTRGPAALTVLFFFAVIFFGTVNGRKFARRIKLLLSIGILLVGAAVAPMFIARTFREGEDADILSGRSYAWSYFWRFVEDAPLFGNGTGSFSRISELSGEWYLDLYFTYPHNTYLQLLLDFGWVGLLIVLASFGLIFAEALRKSEPVSRLMLVILVAGMAGYAFFDNLLAAPQAVVPFVMLTAAFGSIKEDDLTPSQGSSASASAEEGS